MPHRNTTFFAEHKDGIVAVWHRDQREWLRQRFVAEHGTEPPEGWWIDRAGSEYGGTVAPGLKRALGTFDREQQQAFFDEMEARYRAEAGLPQKGEGWVSQTYLARCVEAALPDEQILREASPDWLAPQRLDIYVPSRALAIEYQGEQHYYSLDHWGSEQGLVDRQAMDQRKREACTAADVTLIEWRYDEPITVETVRARLGGIRASASGTSREDTGV